MRSYFILASIIAVFVPSLAFADPLVGYWSTEEQDAVVEFYPCEETFCGRFVWLQEDSAEQPSIDEKNVNADERGRPLCGMNFLGDFEKEGEGLYVGGWIYSPRHGSRFGAQLKLQDENTLVLRGYFIIPALGGEQVWKRTEKPEFCWKLAAE